MSDPVLLVFTVEGEDLIRKRGWSGYWPVNLERAKEFKYIIFCQNLNKAKAMKEDWESFATASKPHSTGFLLAKVTDVVPANQLDPGPNVEDRSIFTLSQVAKIDVPNLWKGWRFPVNYEHTLQDLGIDLDGLLFDPMPPPTRVETGRATQSVSLSEPVGETGHSDLADIERYAAKRLGVRPDEVEIAITLLPRRRAA